jgi:hydrogenase small subunit
MQMSEKSEIDVLWLTAGLGCDGESVALTNATQPSLEDILSGAIPRIPKVNFHNPLYAYESGEDFVETFHRAANGEIKDFILIVEGSIPDENNKSEGYWATFGVDENLQPITTSEWINRLAKNAWAVAAMGTCSAYGGVHASVGNPTGAMGLPDYLGWDWRSKADVPLVCVAGCPTLPDNMTQTLVYLLQQFTDFVPMIELDEVLRPRWLYEATLHEGCDRGGYYEQAQFAEKLGDKECIVKQGCWGPVVNCNVGKRGWTNGVGGCANVGGVCIGCTMPAFPEKFSPFLSQPPGSLLSSQAIATYGKAINSLRRFTLNTMNKTPEWRKREMPLVQIEGLQKNKSD